jgi:hypothetical protein
MEITVTDMSTSITPAANAWRHFILHLKRSMDADLKACLIPCVAEYKIKDAPVLLVR